MTSTPSNRGFASMDATRQKELASKGGKASGGSFQKGDPRASEAGRLGAKAQPLAAKVLGGKRSHRATRVA